MDISTFGDWMKQRRNQLRLTQRETAAAAFCSPAMIRKIEADERQPSPELALLLAEALAVPLPQRSLFVAVARSELPITALSEPDSAGRTASDVPHNLPPQPTPFIGRDRELAELTALLRQKDRRLVTIFGPGGMGKTRLALACAGQFMAAPPATATPFPDGLFFVNLAPLSAAANMIPAIAESLGFRLQGDKSERRTAQQQLLDFLREKRLLLVLDNFEHLVDRVELISTILQAAPGVQMLVTSREKLNLRQEQVFPLAGLAFPEGQQPAIQANDHSLATFSAVALFALVASRNQPSFQPDSDDNRAAMGKVCQMVAGMPLAIELAAAWTDTLSLAEIAAEIQTNLDFLETDMRDVPERHRSIRAVFESSWQKLSPAEQSAFAQLSVFHGGFTRRAGQTITTAALRQLSRLVAKSFVQYDLERERYQLHELLRQFGAEKLAEDVAVANAVRRRHSVYYCQALADRTVELQGHYQKEAVAEIELDNENVRAAWEWAVAQRDTNLMALACFTLFRFYEWHGRFEDYQSALNQGLAALNARRESPAEHALLIQLLHLKFARTRNLGEQRAILDQTTTLLAHLNGADVELQRLQAQDRFYTGQWQAAIGDQTGARGNYQVSLAFFEQAGLRWPQIEIWRALGNWAARQGLYNEADQYVQEALRLARAVGDRWHIAMALHELGYIANNRGRNEAMRAYMEESLQIATEIGQIPLQGLMLMEIGTSYVVEKQPARAIPFYEESLRILRRVGDRQRLAWTMLMLAWAKIGLVELAEAEAWLRAAHLIVQQIDDVRTVAYYHNASCFVALIHDAPNAALEHAEAAVALIEGTGSGVDIAAGVFTGLGWARLALGQRLLAEKAVYEALLLKNVFSRDALLPVAYLLVQRQRTEARVKQAWQLIGLYDRSAMMARWSATFAMLERLQPAALFSLSAEEIEVARATGMAMDPDNVIAELVTDLPTIGWGS